VQDYCRLQQCRYTPGTALLSCVEWLTLTDTPEDVRASIDRFWSCITLRMARSQCHKFVGLVLRMLYLVLELKLSQTM